MKRPPKNTKSCLEGAGRKNLKRRLGISTRKPKKRNRVCDHNKPKLDVNHAILTAKRLEFHQFARKRASGAPKSLVAGDQYGRGESAAPPLG